MTKELIIMILLEFTPEKKIEYTIIRDYYVDRKDLKGIVFVLQNEESKEVFTRILPENQINNAYIWEEIKKEDCKFMSSGIEKAGGDSQRLIVEYGTMKAEKRNITGKKKEVKFAAKRYRYVLNN